MLKLLPPILLFSFLASCSNKEETKNENKNKESNETNTENSANGVTEGSYIIGEDSVTILPFEIEVKLSGKASELFNKGKETIIINIFFSGTPKENSGAELEEDGTFFVASASKEFTYEEGKAIKFDDIRISKKIYDQLEDKNIDYGVNIYSGRKTSEDNLLSCEALFDKINKLVNQKIISNGKLIYGDE